MTDEPRKLQATSRDEEVTLEQRLRGHLDSLPPEIDRGQYAAALHRALHQPVRPLNRQVDVDDFRAALIALTSGHMPEIFAINDDDPGDVHIGCSCGSGIYLGHLVQQIVKRFYPSEDA